VYGMLLYSLLKLGKYQQNTVSLLLIIVDTNSI
jgi:hypothetical protein